ncbi:MAG: nitrite reductase small subunit NirD [Syntrophothermus sp.]
MSSEHQNNGYFKICKVTDLPEKSGRRFFIDDVDIAIFKIDGEIFAVNNVCPHQHAAIIYDGFIEDKHIVCPSHGWMFNLETGKMKLGNGGCLDVHKTKVENGEVFVKPIKKELKW